MLLAGIQRFEPIDSGQKTRQNDDVISEGRRDLGILVVCLVADDVDSF